MTISRGQMNRQLRMSGGIMDVVPREPAILGGIKKAVKKATKGVKKIIKSPIGKAALLYAGTAGLGALGAKLGSGVTGSGFGLLKPSNVLANLEASKAFLADKFLGPVISATGEEPFRKGTKFSKFFEGNLGKVATLGLVSKFLTDTLGVPPEQAEAELARDPSGYLEKYYRNLNPNATEEEVIEFVTANTQEYAVGGRVGFAEGDPLPPDPTQPVNPFKPKPIGPVLPNKEMASYGYNEAMSDTFDMFLDMKKKGLIPPTMDFDEFLQEVVPEMGSKRIEETRGVAALGGRMGFSEGTPDDMRAMGIESLKEDIQIPMDEPQGLPSITDKFEEEMVVIIQMDENGQPKLIQVPKSEVMPDMGGSRKTPPIIVTEDRMNKAKGDSASMNAMQAASVEGLPIRKNQAGIRELDLRKTGGFIPPVGIKEKADDIPAMLSNNEFVMTADAVRGMGDGNVNLGAQRMYDQMKMLEAGGKV